MWAFLLACTAAGGAAAAKNAVNHGCDHNSTWHRSPSVPKFVFGWINTSIATEGLFVQSIAHELYAHFGRQHVMFRSSWWDERRRQSANDALSSVLLDRERRQHHPDYLGDLFWSNHSSDGHPPPPVSSMDALKTYLAQGSGERADTYRPTSAVLRRVELESRLPDVNTTILHLIAKEVSQFIKRPGVSINAYISASGSSALASHTDR